MSIVIHGVVHGKTIELKESPGVPDGQEVEVVVKVVEPSRPWGEGILRSAGAAADVPGVDEAFAEIQREAQRLDVSGARAVSFLLDTNICSSHIRRPAGLAHRFMQHSGRLWMSSVALAELYAWAYIVAQPDKILAGIDELRKDVGLLPFDERCAEEFGKLRGVLKSTRRRRQPG